MQAGASAGVVAEIVLVGVEAAIVATGTVVLYAGMWGFKVLKRAI